MSGLDALLLIAAPVALVFGGVFGRAFRDIVHERAWRRFLRHACQRYGLQVVEAGGDRPTNASGEVETRRLTVGRAPVDGSPTTRFMVVANLPDDVAIDGGGLREDAREVGAEYLDASFSVCGEPVHVAALLDADARQVIRETCVLGVRVFKGNVIFQTQRNLSNGELTERIDAMLRLAATLDKDDTLAQRLLAVVTKDPEPHPRRRAAELLVTCYTDAPETAEAAVFCRTATDPWLRLWGFRQLRAAGCERLIDLIRDGALPASLRVEATRALLDSAEGAAIGGPVLHANLGRLHGQVLVAALEVLEQLRITPSLSLLESRYAAVGHTGARVALVGAMKRHKEKSLKALRRFAVALDTPTDVRVAALGGLGDFGTQEDLPIVEGQRLSLPPRVGSAARDAAERLKVRLGAGGLTVLNASDVDHLGGLSSAETADSGAVSTVDDPDTAAMTQSDDMTLGTDA